jgi:hypothetical protein
MGPEVSVIREKELLDFQEKILNANNKSSRVSTLNVKVFERIKIS